MDANANSEQTSARVDVAAYRQKTSTWPDGNGIWMFTPKHDDSEPVILVGDYAKVRQELPGGAYTLTAWKKEG